jgi:transaldolase
MANNYFQRVMQQSPTIFWVNNPTRAEADLAIAAGAMGCTCNPSFTQKMIDHPTEGLYALGLLDEAVRESEEDNEAVAILQRKLVHEIAERFRPLYERNTGKHGHVSIQGDPVREHDPKVILHEAHLNREIAPNACIKVPCTASGLAAMETLIAEDFPINATEIFGVAQAISLCELYENVTGRRGRKPKMYLSHIAGIYDDYLKQFVEREKVQISPDILWQAGLAVARKVYQIIQERGYHVTFIGGGARGLHHFIEMVGGDLVVTINWAGTADKLIETDPPVVYRLFNPVPKRVIDELKEKLPDFSRGYREDGLTVEEYEEFGPVAHFRGSFIRSWKRVLQLAQERRIALNPTILSPKDAIR